MRIVKRIVNSGPNSKALIIPRRWLKECERKMGKPVEMIMLDLVPMAIILTPADKAEVEQWQSQEKNKLKAIFKAFNNEGCRA